MMNNNFLNNNVDQIKGLDPKFLNDDLNYTPNTEYSVQLNFKQEYIKHKRVLCSIKEFDKYDIQSEWDIGFCKTFC